MSDAISCHKPGNTRGVTYKKNCGSDSPTYKYSIGENCALFPRKREKLILQLGRLPRVIGALIT